ncbi:hypothetical protein NW766_004545 [Fusarium irregulare]|uniref:C2H2-type domain-containing protein n=1 Tax=Fusarium irregulare TaxID=2494466 RepID=A0A9W8PUF5_9HYPO|nr:hypothetical protein NW766_004545 [Fusarium irregulare]
MAIETTRNPSCVSKEALKRHRRKHNAASKTAQTKDEATSAHPCTVCKKSFNSELALRNHTGAKHPGSKTETKQPSPNNHQVPATTTPFCTICKKEFLTENGFGQHMRAKHSLSPDAAVAKKIQATQTRDEVVPQAKPYSCGLCGKTFGTKQGKDCHRKSAHPGQKMTRPPPNYRSRRNRSESDVEGPVYMCFQCTEFFRDPASLQRHQKTRRGCERPVTRALLDQHKRRNQETAIPTNKPKKEDKRGAQSLADDIPCIGESRECEERFKKASDMMLHIESGNCTAWEADDMWLTFHVDDMTDESRKFYDVEKECFTCPECKGSTFKNFTSLILHAEGDSCSMNPLKGPLHDAPWEIPDLWDSSEDESEDEDGYETGDSDEYDVEYSDSDSDAWCKDDNPWDNGFKGHPQFQYEFSVDEMARYGY